MPYYFRAVAVDYDGTIADSDTVNHRVVAACHELRRRARRVVLCTGRILDELRRVFPEVDQHFDAIVAENGAVLAMPGRGERALGQPLPPVLLAALEHRGVPFRAGSVLLATQAQYAKDVLSEVTDLGLDAQLVRNRGELMILPSGITKATGLLEALGELEVSRHSTIAFGDAENDIALLQSCEVGVAVGNAVKSLRACADIVTDEDDGDGVAAFMLGPVLSGEIAVRPSRWQVELGRTEEGNPVRLPASRINVLVAGVSGTGKSFVAGAFVERLATLGYSACIFDSEGDHAGLAELRGVVVVGGADPLPAPPQLARIVRNRFSSVVVDMSTLSHGEKHAYFHAAMNELLALRRSSGLPHWIVVEEADQLLTDDALPGDEPHLAPLGYCLVTHRPGALSRGVLQAVDAVIALPGAERYAPGVRTDPALAPDFTLQAGEALVSLDGVVTQYRIGGRQSQHVRHQRKYVHAQVPNPQRFYFGDGAVAANLAEFCAIAGSVTDAVLRQHLQAGDFSRWVRDVLADDELGGRLRSIERWYRTEQGLDLHHVRDAIMVEIEARYGAEALSGAGS